MRFTSSEANKFLRKLNDDLATCLNIESQSRSFLAATGEDVESARPEYNYEETKKEIENLSKKIRIVKHAINVFNTNTVVPGFDMTIDEMLVFLPQLSNRVIILNTMRNELPKVREQSYGQGISTTIDYRYINYDLETVKRDYEEKNALLSKAQTALDYVNNTETLEIEL